MRSLELPTKIIIVTTSLLLSSRLNSSDAFLPTAFVTRSPRSHNGLDIYRSTGSILLQTPNDIDTDESNPSSTISRRKRRIRKKDDPTSVESEEIESAQHDDTVTSEQAVVKATTQQQQQQPTQESQSTKSTVATISLKPRKESRVAMNVRDVREVTNIGIVESTKSTTSDFNNFLSSLPFFDNKGDNVKQQSTTTVSKSISSSNDDNIDYDEMDPIQRLLYDAKQMQKEESNAIDDTGRTKLATMDDDDGSIGSRIRSIISTIVTVDFFVVCGFLLWFLAGIFASVVLKDDTIQIAFNSNFQQLVQPALGILMIAALADAVFKNKDDEEG